MSTIDFTTELKPNGQISVPPEIAAQVPPGAHLQVLLSWDRSGNGAHWRAVGRDSFNAAYAPEDSVYDSL